MPSINLAHYIRLNNRVGETFYDTAGRFCTVVFALFFRHMNEKNNIYTRSYDTQTKIKDIRSRVATHTRAFFSR